MIKVKNELQFLKAKNKEAGEKLSGDSTITKLQDNIKMFRNEALKLDQILEV